MIVQVCACVSFCVETHVLWYVCELCGYVLVVVYCCIVWCVVMFACACVGNVRC